MTIIPPGDRDLSKEVEPGTTDITETPDQADNRYVTVATPLIRLGYPVMPVRRPGENYISDGIKKVAKGKEPAVRLAHLPEVDGEEALAEICGWGPAHGDRPGAAWLLRPLGGSGAPILVVIDVDDLDELPWVTSTFGSSPLEQESGRVGGGLHRIFRWPKGEPELPGSRRSIGGHKVDLKCGRNGYIVAPGSPHAITGKPYKLTWNGKPIDPADLTLEMLYEIPEIDVAVLMSVLADRPDPPSNPSGGGGGGGGGFRDFTFSSRGGRGTSPSGLVRMDGDPGVVVPVGRWAGHTLVDVAKGVQGGFVDLACPFRGLQGDGRKTHKSEDGGKARLYVKGGVARSLVCHACGITYRLDDSVGHGGKPTSVVSIDDIVDCGISEDDEFDAVEDPHARAFLRQEQLEEATQAEADRGVRTLPENTNPMISTSCDDFACSSPYKEKIIGIRTRKNALTPRNHDTHPTDPDPAMEAAEARVGGRSYIWCPSGHRVVGAPKEQLAVSRTPCRSYRCSVCGPWQIDALRAAAWAVIGVLVGDWDGVTIHTTMGNRRLTEALQRGHKGSPSNRHYLSIATTPRTLQVLILWRDDEPGHLPSRGLRRQILTLDDGIHGNAEWHNGTDALAEAADAMVAAVDRHAWADAVSDPFDPIRRATVLRGDRDLVGQISRVRDHLLGRTRPGAERTGSTWTPTTRCTDDIVSEVGLRARHATKHLPFETLALAASGRPERMPMTAWIRGLRYARVVEPAPKVVSTITDAEGEHEVIDDGHDHRRRSLTRRFDLDDAGGIRIVDIHASMLADDFYSPSVLKMGGRGFVDLSLGSSSDKARLAGGGGGDG